MKRTLVAGGTAKQTNIGFRGKCLKDFKKNKCIYLMLLPVLAYFLIFHYLPMYGAIIAFKDYDVAKGIMASDWVGLAWFKKFFSDYTFIRVLRNTILISVENIIWGFPVPIIFALLLNEVRNEKFKRIIQSVTYLPHFISMVVICGLITQFFSRNGIITNFLTLFGLENTDLLSLPQLFRSIYIGTGIWQEMGWGCIIYLSALTAIDPQMYEAATVEGAGKFKQVIYITIPGIVPTIVVMLILRVGQLMSVGYEKIMLLYSPLTYETADIISTYLYRVGMLEGAQYSYSTAIGLFNSAVNLVLIVLTNKISKQLSGNGLW